MHACTDPAGVCVRAAEGEEAPRAGVRRVELQLLRQQRRARHARGAAGAGGPQRRLVQVLAAPAEASAAAGQQEGSEAGGRQVRMRRQRQAAPCRDACEGVRRRGPVVVVRATHAGEERRRRQGARGAPRRRGPVPGAPAGPGPRRGSATEGRCVGPPQIWQPARTRVLLLLACAVIVVSRFDVTSPMHAAEEEGVQQEPVDGLLRLQLCSG